MPRRKKRGKKRKQQQPDPQPQVSPRPPSPQPGPSGLAPPAETNEVVVELYPSGELRAPEAGALSLAPGDRIISAKLNLTIEEVERRCKDKRPADTAEQGPTAPKRPKVQEGPQQATQSEGNIMSIPMNFSGVTYEKSLVDGLKKLLVKYGWTNASAATTPTVNTNIKVAAVQTTIELQYIQMDDSDVVEKEPEKDPEDPKTDATIELVAPQSESAFSWTDGNSSNQMGAVVAVNDTSSLSVTGSSVVVKTEPEMDTFDDAVEDSKPLPGLQTECPLCLTHGYSRSHPEVMDDIKPSLFDNENINVAEKEPENDPEDDTPKDPKTDATTKVVAPQAESAFSWTDGNSSNQMGAEVAVNGTPSLSVTGSSVVVKTEPEMDSFDDAVEDSKPLPGLQTECHLCLTHGYSRSHVEVMDDIKPSLFDNENIDVVEKEPEKDPEDDTPKDPKTDATTKVVAPQAESAFSWTDGNSSNQMVPAVVVNDTPSLSVTGSSVVVKTEPEMDSFDDAVEDSKPLPGLQTECHLCLTHGYSRSHVEVMDDIKPSLFDNENINVAEKEPENDPEDDTPKDPKTDATTKVVAPQAESAFSWTDGNSSNQMGAEVAVNGTPSLSVTGSSVVVKTEPEMDSFDDAVEDSKPLPGLQTECHLCLTHGYSRSHVEVMDDIKPSLFDNENIDVVEKEPEKDPEDDTPKDPKTDAATKVVAPQAESAFSWTDGNSSNQMVAAVVVNDTPSSSVTGSSVVVKTEPEMDSFDDAVEDSKPLPGLQTECHLCLTHGYSRSHVEVMDDIKPSLFDNENIDVVEKEPEKDPEDDTPKDPKTDATTEVVSPQAESAFSWTDGNSSKQMVAAVVVNDTPSSSVTGSSVVVKTEPESDSFDDAVEDSKPLPGLQTECHLCLTHGYSRSHVEVMDDIKPSLFDNEYIDVVEKEPEKDPEDDTPKDPKTDATTKVVAPQAESAFSWTDGNSSKQMVAAVVVNDTPSSSVTGSSIVVKTEQETDSFNDAVEDSKPLPGPQTECRLCLTHGYSSSHLEDTDDIKPTLSDDANIVVVKTEPEMDSLDDAVEDSKPLPGLQTECPLCLTHGYSSSHLEVTDDIKPSLFDDDDMPHEESNLQPTAQHTYGGRSEQGN